MDAEERATLDLIDQRDRAEEMLDSICYEVTRIFKLKIGEHSNVNDPWQNTLDYLKEVKIEINMGDLL